jgi:formylglycine-generating enzyme required for sulfatase activity
MDPERWNQVDKLFHAALEQTPEVRAAFLAEACAGDEELRREVSGLLAYDDSNTGFIDTPAIPGAAKALADGPQADVRTGWATGAHLTDTPTTGSPSLPAVQAGQAIRNFRIVRKIGEGGMGEVFLAEDIKLGRRVALKLLPAKTGLDPQARQRFLREARSASSLNHSNIVTIHAVDEVDGLDFIVMEYVEGEPLKAVIQRGPLGFPQLLDIGPQIADAVAAAHAIGIIHRDLKPGNVLVTPDGRAKVLDFGLAMRVPALSSTNDPQSESVSRLTDTGLVVGTIPYMSPEQTRGESLDARSDIFSLGCLLYEAATGKRPFNGPSALAVMHEIATLDPPPPSKLQPELPSGFDCVIQRALAKDKGQRYGSAAELSATLRDLGTAKEREGRRKSRSRLIALASVVASLALIAGIWFCWHQANLSWARAIVPRVAELAEAENYFEAYDLAAQVEKYLPDDPPIVRLMPFISDDLSVTTDPPGAKVYLKRFARDASGQFPSRQLIGTTPIQELRVARGDYVLAIEKDGYAPVQRTISSRLDRLENGLWKRGEIREARLDDTGGRLKMYLDASAPIRVEAKLIEADKMPEGMVLVRGGPGRPRRDESGPRQGNEYDLVGWGKPTSAKVRLDDYFIDRYEVSNREYKEFITAGGYRTKQFWRHPFHKDGKGISWEEAIKQFTDRTGLAGPRSWSNQEYPEGKADHPVTDVCWYEAAAYAEFRGKQLSTVFQWEKAARDGADTVFWGTVLPWGYSAGGHDNLDDRANFKGQGTMPVDSLEFGMSPFGCYNMAGNVAEWCFNRRPLGFSTMGGSWKDMLYLFAHYGQFPGFYSAPWLGFRCARNGPNAVGDQGAMAINDEDEIPKVKPVNEAQFRAMLRFYEYDKTPLEAQIVEVKETDDWRREKITYRGAGPDRAFGYLWLPKHSPRPLQLINYDPGGGSYSGLTVPQETEVVCAPFIKSGRAVFVVVLQGMSERKMPPDFVDAQESSVKFREMVVTESIDQRRGLDYLATRPEIDMSKIASFALSAGGTHIVLRAVETRYRSILILSGGLWNPPDIIAEAAPVNFAPYVGYSRKEGVPKLMLHGRYDEGIQLKTGAEPLFKLLSEPKDPMILYDSGHFPPMEKWVPDAKKFFDKTLGPVPGQ